MAYNLTYTPFSGGNRKCPGLSFATMAAVLVIADIAQCWRVEVVSDAFPRVCPIGVYRMHPQSGLPVRVRTRRPMSC